MIINHAKNLKGFIKLILYDNNDNFYYYDKSIEICMK